MNFHSTKPKPPFRRLRNFDYSQPGGYFVTMCTVQRECMLGKIEAGSTVLSPVGKIVREEWLRSPSLQIEIRLDEFVVMPNHLHGIVFIEAKDDRLTDERLSIQKKAESHCRARLQNEAVKHRGPRSLASFISSFKAYTARQANILLNTPGSRLWQPDYYEHVIRDDDDLRNIRQYIVNNPLQWELDKENPDRRL